MVAIVAKQTVGNALYGTFNKEAGDAFVARLGKIGLCAEILILIDKDEEMIFFEILRASTELNIKGATLQYSMFNRSLISGKLSWGNSTFFKQGN